jgi:hypothetical protein
VGGAQSRHGDGDEPADRSLGPKGARSGERVQAVPCELLSGDVLPDFTELCALGHEIPDQLAQVLLRANHMLPPDGGAP